MRVEELDVLEFFIRSDSIKRGHFIISGGLHTAVYINEYEALSYVAKVHKFCDGIVERFADDGIEVIVGLEGHGAILAPWTAQNMNITGRKVLGISAEKLSDDDLAGKNVLVVESILTTRDTARKVIAAVRKIGGNVIGLGALWNRGGITPQDMDVPKVRALINVKIYAWNEMQCVHCKLGIPITVGRR